MKQVETNNSRFKNIKSLPPDPIFGIAALFNEDLREDKVNLTVGYLASEEGAHPVILDAVADASREILETEQTKNYLPISGDQAYVESVKKFIFDDLASEKILGYGTAGGTAAIRLISEFVFEHITNQVCVSSPTWPNHVQILQRIGFQINYYPYQVEEEINFNKVVDHLSQQPKNTLVLFQPMAHNPTGYDFSMDEWKVLSNLCKEKRLVPFFDCAYQGLGVGIREDVEPICQFIRDGHELFVTHSFSKSMGLYGERVGSAFVVMSSDTLAKNVDSQMKMITRTHYSNPPRHGEALANLILTNPERRTLWERQLTQMRERVDSFRKSLGEEHAKITGKDCKCILDGHGFFCNLGLSKDQVVQLREEFGVYLTGSSRVNIAALNDHNFPQVITSLSKLFAK